MADKEQLGNTPPQTGVSGDQSSRNWDGYASSCVLPGLEPVEKCDKRSNLPRSPGDLELDNFTEDIMKQIENAFQIEDKAVQPLLSPICFDPAPLSKNEQNGTTEAIEARKPSSEISPKGSPVVSPKSSPKRPSLKQRLRSFTSVSRASMNDSDNRDSWQSQSSGRPPRSLRSNSVTTVNTTTSNSISSPTSGKRNSNLPPSPQKIVKYVGSPHDYMFLDLDVCSESRPVNPGLLQKPRINETEQQTQEPSQDTKPSVYQRLVGHVKSDRNSKELDRGTFQELIDYIRAITNTQTKPKSPSQSAKSKVKPHDLRKWGTRNLKCTVCRGECPVCGASCCIHEQARRVVVSTSDTSAAPEQVHKARRILYIVETLGPHVRDISTFSLCSEPDGCGRYVCPDCAGVCPNGVCRDVQCKECKPDPWCPCDWHGLEE